LANYFFGQVSARRSSRQTTKQGKTALKTAVVAGAYAKRGRSGAQPLGQAHAGRLEVTEGAMILPRKCIAGCFFCLAMRREANESIKIDRLRGFSGERPFPEKVYLSMMYVAHDLAAISNCKSSPDHRPLMTHTLR
jgi:hypothetical protein